MPFPSVEIVRTPLGPNNWHEPFGRNNLKQMLPVSEMKLSPHLHAEFFLLGDVWRVSCAHNLFQPPRMASRWNLNPGFVLAIPEASVSFQSFLGEFPVMFMVIVMLQGSLSVELHSFDRWSHIILTHTLVQ